jgi:hypothetical protein
VLAQASSQVFLALADAVIMHHVMSASELLSVAMSTLGDLPVTLRTESRLVSTQMEITDVIDGRLIAKCDEAGFGVGAELRVSTTSNRRAAYRLAVIVESREGDRLKLLIHSIDQSAGRRAVERSPLDELILISGDEEFDAVVTNISQVGLHLISPREIRVGDEIRGILNLAGRVFPIAADVRHVTSGHDGFHTGVSFRALRAAERELFIDWTSEKLSGRRLEERAALPQSPRTEDIRLRLRRWAA